MHTLAGRHAVVASLLVAVSCGAAGLTTEERVTSTAEVLEAFLTPEGARREAERLVLLCRDDHEEMALMIDRYLWDPEGPELFDTLEQARDSGRAGATGVKVTDVACTAEDEEAVYRVFDV